MKFLVMFLTIWVSMGSTNSLSYPIFGTKRYHRGSSPRTEMTQHILRQPVYENGYLMSNGYYYYPHHEYHSYGMPTYRGEYKPKAYYYSAGPSYNYYNDREPVSNPLDDLHEEILQENEQERQTDLLSDDDYDEEYYLEPSETQQDTYTNNFLRNMMDYNRQKEKHQRLQQLHQQQRDQLNEDTDVEEEHHADDDYFSEIGVNPDDYQFEPKGEDNFDLQKYWDAEMSSLANGEVTGTGGHHQRATLNEPSNDEEVDELKSLTQHDANNDEEDYNKRYHVKTKQAQPSHLNNWREQQTSESTVPQQKEHEDDYSAFDYDDGSWINWDRKRSQLPENTRLRTNDKILSDFMIQKRVMAASKKSQHKLGLESNTMSTKAPATIVRAFGQKEYSTEGSLAKSASSAVEQNNIYYNSIKEHSKSPAEIEQNIYDTIKQMISIQQELKKTGSKKRKRFISDEGNLVTQLDSLRRIKN